MASSTTLVKRLLIVLLLFKAAAMLFSCYRHCSDVQFSQSNEEGLILAMLSDNAPVQDSPHRGHAIPNVLVFTHYINLLEYDGSNSTNDGGRSFDPETQQELIALRRNVRDAIDMHPNATVRFLTDEDCEQSIRNVLGHDTPLVEYFQNETRGMYKSDICRGAALWETGGLYFDVDLGVRMPVWNILGTHTSFVTSKVHERSKQRPGFFQAFIGSTPQHPILQRYLELFVKYYEGELKLQTNLLAEHKQLLGVRLLFIAYDQILREEEEERERRRTGLLRSRQISSASQRRRMSDASEEPRLGAVELWQEVFYSREQFPYIPEPTWGTEKSCKYVVVANKGWPPAVPFYSRVEGSRMCPVDDDEER